MGLAGILSALLGGLVLLVLGVGFYIFGGIPAVVALMGGLVLYVLIPIVITGGSAGAWIGHRYGSLAMRALDRAVIVAGEGGYRLHTLWNDRDSHGALTYSSDGEEHTVRDRNGYMASLYGRPVGVKDADSSHFRRPFHAEIGEFVRPLLNRGWWIVKVASQTFYARFAEIPEQPGIIDPRGILNVDHGSATGRSKAESKQFTLKGLAGYVDSPGLLKTVALFGQAIIAFILVWWVTNETFGAGGDGGGAIGDINESVITGSVNYLHLVLGVVA